MEMETDQSETPAEGEPAQQKVMIEGASIILTFHGVGNNETYFNANKGLKPRGPTKKAEMSFSVELCLAEFDPDSQGKCGAAHARPRRRCQPLAASRAST